MLSQGFSKLLNHLVDDGITENKTFTVHVRLIIVSLFTMHAHQNKLGASCRHPEFKELFLQNSSLFEIVDREKKS